jgi:hypothetical protein
MRSTHTLQVLRLFLDDLLDKRHADLVKSKAGKFREAELVEQRDKIQALPVALTGGTPLADVIEAADGIHDGFGGSLYYATEAVFRNPDSTDEQRGAAQRVRDAFIPALKELKSEYAIEAARARDRQPLLKERKADLMMIQSPSGGTLYEVAQKFINAGLHLDELLSMRADVPQNKREGAGVIRSETIGLINRFRADLSRELSKNPSLPQDLDRRVFGYLDTLGKMVPKSTPAPVPPTPPA